MDFETIFGKDDPFARGLWAALVESPDPILVADQDQRVLFSNQAYRQWTTKTEGIRERTLREIFALESLGTAGQLAGIEAGLMSGNSWSGYLRREVGERSDSPAETFRTRFTPIRPALSESVWIIVQLHDVTPGMIEAEAQGKRQAATDLRRLFQLMLAGLESPASVLSWSARLDQTELDRVPADMREKLVEIRAASQRILELFTHLQDSYSLEELPSDEAPRHVLLHLLLVGERPERAAALLYGLRECGLNCNLRSVRTVDAAVERLRHANIDAVLLGSSIQADEAGRYEQVLGQVPVFDADRLDVAALAHDLEHRVVLERLREYSQHSWRRIADLAMRDGLTGCLNRGAFDQRALTELAVAQRANMPTTLALFDLDHFKTINDRFGHQEGDRLLQAFGAVLLTGTRESDLVGRFGGDEFAVLMRNTEIEGGEILLRRLMNSMRTVCEQYLSTELGVSCGLACTGEGGVDSLAELLRRADQQLYRNKMERRGQPQGEASA